MEPYKDPELDPPKSLRKGGAKDRNTGGRFVRRPLTASQRLDDLEQYGPSVFPPPVPGFYQEGSYSSRPPPLQWVSQNQSQAPYTSGYTLYDAHVGPAARRPNLFTYDAPQTFDYDILDSSQQTRSRRIPVQYPVPLKRTSRSRSRSRSPQRHAASEASSIFRARTLRPRSHASYGSDSEPDSDSSSLGRPYAFGGDESPNENDYTNTKVYEFTPSRPQRSPSQDRSIAASGSEAEGVLSEAENNAAGQAERLSTSGTTRTLPIYRSEYTGDAFADGSHSARLTVIHDPRRTRQPIFKWIHIKQVSLNFDELSHEATRIPGLGDADKSGLAKLLAEVKKSCVKTTPAAKGSSVKHMEPRFIQLLLPPDQRSKGHSAAIRTATWLCIPYFSLEKYAGPLSAADTATFPAQTLLQAQYSGVPPERDLQQVVQKLGHVPPETCFYINQLWCIILDNSLLITCGTDSAEAAIESDILDIVREPLKSPAAGGATIYVYYTEAVLWALPVEECTSWFAFISHFHDFWPRTLNFFHRERPVTAEDWPRILNLARHSNSKTMLHLKIGKPPQPPPGGILKPIAKGALTAENTTPDVSQQSLKPPEKGKGKGDAAPPTPSESGLLPGKTNDKFHVFSWLETAHSTSDLDSQIQLDPLRAQLQEVEDYLLNGTSFSDQKAYQDCQLATRLSCFRYLKEQGALTEQFRNRPRRKQEYEDRIDIVNAADIIYRFFLPAGFEGPTVKKFWGAVSLIIQMPQAEENVDRKDRRKTRGSAHTNLIVPLIRSYLRKLTQAIQSFKNILSYAQPLERASISIPDDLIRAWLHILMAMIYSSQGALPWAEHSDVARTLIKGGMAKVIEEIASDSLLTRAVILPMEVVSLISLKLLQDATGAYPNIGETYSEYLDALANEIATKPSERSIQHRISLLKQEIGVVMRTVAVQSLIYSSIIQSRFKTQVPGSNESPELRARERQQLVPNYDGGGRNVARSVRDGDYSAMEMSPRPYLHVRRYRRDNQQPWANYFDADPRQNRSRFAAHDAGVEDWMFAPEEFYKLAPTDPGGFRELLAAECLSFLEKRAREFDGFDMHADDLQEENMNKFEDTKDRQEQAIYAFTIVTVIFLPLSFVAGVFGMNTSDIRDMELGQWAYWASAIPTTVVVILIGLWWMDELGNAFAWLFRIGGSQRGGGGYAPLSAYSNRFIAGGGRSAFSPRLLLSGTPVPAPAPPPYQEQQTAAAAAAAMYGARAASAAERRGRLRQRAGAYTC